VRKRKVFKGDVKEKSDGSKNNQKGEQFDTGIFQLALNTMSKSNLDF
jgi:hypothetical protein